MSSQPYEIIELDAFRKNIRKFFRRDEKKIREKLKQTLGYKPDRYQMLEGKITVAGMKLFGLRHIKVGVKGYRNGAATRFRICEECLREEYYKKSKIKCQFCDENKPRRVVLFDILPRGFGYQ